MLIGQSTSRAFQISTLGPLLATYGSNVIPLAPEERSSSSQRRVPPLVVFHSDIWY
jgi:hypothetical protein